VLESLPEWFGIPASVENYITAADELRMLACFGPAGEVIGFVSIKKLIRLSLPKSMRWASSVPGIAVE
jgi:hypothetical protein